MIFPRRVTSAAAVALLIFSSSAWMGIAPSNAFARGTRIVVTTDNAPIQSGREILGRTRRGQQLEVLRTEGDWQLVRINSQPNGGWIHRKHTQTIGSVSRSQPKAEDSTVKEQCLTLYKMAQEFRDQGKNLEAVAPFEKAAELAAEAFANKQGHVAIIYNLGVLYEFLAEYQKAEATYLQARRLHEQLSTEPDPDIELALGIVYRKTGQYAKGEQFCLRSLQLYTAKSGADSLDVARSLNSLSFVYESQGRFAESEPALLRCLKIRETHLGDHPLVADTLNNLASIYQIQQDDSKPEQLYLRALKLGRAGNDLRTSRTMHNLATFYSHVGQYEKAEPLFRRAIEIQQAQMGANHPSVAGAMSNLGNMYREMGRSQDAERLLVATLDMAEARLGTDHPMVADVLNNLALHYCRMNRLDEATQLLQRVIAIREIRQGENHPDFALALNNLACVYVNNGQYDKALPIQHKSLAIRERILSHSHPDLAQSLYNLGNNCALRQDWATAADFFDRGRRVVRRHINQVLPVLSERQQLSYLRERDEWFLQIALSLGCERRDDPRLAKLSAVWLLNSKGVAQEALAQQALLGRLVKTPEQQALAHELKDTRRKLAFLTYQSPSTTQELQKHKGQLGQLQAREQSLAGRLNSSVGGSVALDSWVELDLVQNAMPANSVFIQISRLQLKDYHTNRFHEEHYFAWLIYPEADSQVRVIDLGIAQEIEKAAAQARRAIRAGPNRIHSHGEPVAERELKAVFDVLAKQVLHPLLPHIKDRKDWLISPDAALWLVPWSAMPLPDGKFAVEKHAVRYLISGRDLLTDSPAIRPRRPIMFADPDYDLKTSDRGANVRGSSLTRAAQDSQVDRSRSLLPRVARLPGTALEAQAISPFLESYTASEPAILQRDEALESAFKAARHPHMMIFSTHGFFLQDQLITETGHSATTDSSNRDRAVLTADGKPLENPLLRCGLLLAGCNERTRSTEIDDGVLTGLEILGVDLRGTELVVLSACETGLGEVRNGNGVAGLRQAFQLAGAEAVVATLWQIPDQETVQLMASFFEHLTANEPKARSLRQAQLSLIAKRRKRNGAAHPYFWAAFTLTGKDD